MIRNIRRLGRTYRHINRYREIISVLAKHGFGDVLSKLPLEKYLDFGKKWLRWPPDLTDPQISRFSRIRMALEELGPAFIKLGQVMSNRPDLLPPALLLELEKLQDAVPPFAEESSRRLIEEELGETLDALFTEFGSRPLASASISQVHVGFLRREKLDAALSPAEATGGRTGGETEAGPGIKVAIKVQRPGIDEIVQVDLEIMFHLAALLSRYIRPIALLNPVFIVEEFERTILQELDFTREAQNLERFQEAFRREATLYVPKVFRAFSTRRILTLEFVDGIKVSRVDAIRAAGMDPSLIAKRGADLLLKQIFEQGFFHADPHPGNILILPDHVIALLDYGMVGSISPQHREHLGSVIVGLVERDPARITKTLLRLSQHPLENHDALQFEVGEILEEYGQMTLRDLRMDRVVSQLIRLIIDHRLRMLPGFYLLLKTIVTMEGVGRRLDPDFDMIERMRPYAKKLVAERLRPGRLFEDVYHAALDLGPVLRELPADIGDIVNLVKRGQARIEFQHRGLEPLLAAHDRLFNRLCFAMVIGSLIIGSSLVIHAGIPPKWHNLPLIGVVMFVAAGLLGFWLVFGIIRHGKWK